MSEVLASLPSEWNGFQFAGNALLARRSTPPSPISSRSLGLMSFWSEAICSPSPPPSEAPPLPPVPGSWLHAASAVIETVRAVAPRMERRVTRI